jgi:hypothetical protein
MDPNAEPSGIEKHKVVASSATTTLVAGKPKLPGGAVTSDQLPTQEDDATTAFMRRIFDAQVRVRLARKKPYLLDLPGDVLVDISAPGVKKGLRLHQSVEPVFVEMFAAATAALRDPHCPIPGAEDVRSIGVASAYRTLKEDTAAWIKAFHTHMQGSKEEREASPGGSLGGEAFHLMLSRMNKKKAPPGFSNHTRGVAVDFSTAQYFVNYGIDRKTHERLSGVVTLGPSSAQKPLWLKSWLYRWLTENADRWGFTQLKTEEWHWEHAE